MKRKKYALTSFAFLLSLLFFFISVSSAGILALPVVEQEEFNWCWAANSAALLTTYGVTNPSTGASYSQCEIAEWARGQGGPYDYGNTDCCVEAGPRSCNDCCNQVNNMIGIGSIADILRDLGGINAHLEFVLSETEVKSLIDALKPFIIRVHKYWWNDQIQTLEDYYHFIVCYGYTEQGGNTILHYMDPWFGEGYGSDEYSTVVKSYQGNPPNTDDQWGDGHWEWISTLVLDTSVSQNMAPNGLITIPGGDVTISVGESIDFTGTGSDPDNNLPLSFLWNFGDPAISDARVEDPGPVQFDNPGTFLVTFTVTDSEGLSDPTPAQVTVNVLTVGDASRTERDFNGDGKSDILWRHASDGRNYMWLMDGLRAQSNGSLWTVSDTSWKIKGVGDFNNDGKSDILWHHSSSGMVYMWLMDGLRAQSNGSPGTVSDTRWKIKGVGDFNNDGKSDILWRRASDGRLSIWLMDGLKKLSHGSPGRLSDLRWQIKGVGDFDNDGKSDIVLRHSSTGWVHLILMDGLAQKSYAWPGKVGLDWKIKGVGDYNGDAESDILWRRASDGKVYIWLMDGVTRQSHGSPGTVSDTRWQIK